MKTNFNRFFIFLLVGLLTICSVEITYNKSVHAMDWVAGTLAFEEAIKWAMAVLGVTATVGMTDAYWDEYGDDFVDYATENGATQTEVANWQLKLCEGVIDKASNVWTLFKSWVKSLTVSGSGSGSGSGSSGTYPYGGSFSVSEIYDFLHENYGLNTSNGLNLSDIAVSPVIVVNYNHQENKYYYYLVYSNVEINSSVVTNNMLNRVTFDLTNSSDLVCKNCNSSSSTWGNFNLDNGDISISGYDLYHSNYVDYYLYGYNGSGSLDDGSNYFPIIYHPIELSGSGSGSVADENFQSLSGVDIDNLDVISDVLPDENADEVAIPMPGLGSSDNVASSDAYDEIVDRINDGTISLDDGISQIQDILKVIVYDTVTDDVIPVKPDPDTGENEKKDDVIKDNKNNMGFTLAGLENVFPFCIPWDIYAFLNLLDAEPVAPVFYIPFPNINDPTHPLTTEVDLSSWDDAMRIVRLAQDFLFIVGLAFLTRNLIGAGGGN